MRQTIFFLSKLRSSGSWWWTEKSGVLQSMGRKESDMTEQLNKKVKVLVTQSCLTLRPHEPQYSRPPCPSPTPRVHPNPCSSSRWCHPTISCSVIPFSSCPQSFPAFRVFLSESANLDSLLKSRDDTLPTNVCLVNAMVKLIREWQRMRWHHWLNEHEFE